MTREEEIKKQAEKKAHEPSRLMHPYAKQYKVMSAYEIGFIEGAEWADEHPHWISVEDELPKINPNGSEWEYSDDVLVAFKDGSIAVGRYERDISTGERYWVLYGVDKDLIVTHWMPLPQAPHHIIDANKKVDRVIGTADHIKTALDVLNKKGGKHE